MKKTIISIFALALASSSYAQNVSTQSTSLDINSILKQGVNTSSVPTTTSNHTFGNKFINSEVEKTVNQSVDINAIMNSNTLALADRGGSDIGGGNLYSSIIAWCDSSSIILEEAKEEALELWGYSNDKVGAIKSFYFGLIAALRSIPAGGINFNNSITYKAISRGIGLSQVLGVPAIIKGQGRQTSDKDLDEIISFLNFYYDLVERISQNLDKRLYAPFYVRSVCTDCTGIPDINTLDLERELVKYTTSQIAEWRTHFIKSRSTSEGYYPTISVVKTLNGLAYLSVESANDLEMSLFNKVYACQAKKLRRLAVKVQHFVTGRMNDSLDAIKLNKFTIKIDEIIKDIKDRDCF